MGQGNEPAEPEVVRVSRVFRARREDVFRAWSTAEHVRRWFSPVSYTVAEAVVELRVGGRFDVCMRSPAGTGHWTRGTFLEVVPPARLAIEMDVTDAAGTRLFRAWTEVGFFEEGGGTRMDVVQRYQFVAPAMAAPMVAGAAEGWRTTLDKLALEVAHREAGTADGVRSVVHATFRLERTYPAPAARVWRALTDPVAKARWFGGPPESCEIIERHMDVRPGGSERAYGRWGGGVVSRFDAEYHDVIAQERLVYSYTMHLDERKISVSLATMELRVVAGGTTLVVTEQGAFLDGYDDAGAREHGTRHLLEALGASLAWKMHDGWRAWGQAADLM
jgi:uncharacterized protein YndB with AHSA1/START domain